MKLLIGTVNFNTKIFTEIWLETLIESLRNIRLGDEEELIVKTVVVNNSPEDDLSDLIEKYKNTVFINNKENVGVASAWNQIIKQGFDDKGNPLYDYFFPANNDIWFSKNWAQLFAACLKQDIKKEFGWISSFLNDYKEPDLTGVSDTLAVEGRYWGGLRPEADDVETIEQIKNVLKSTYAPFGGIDLFAETLKQKYGIKLKKMHPKAPLFALSRECIKKVGLFDEYNSPNGLHEDADYCLRVQKAGFKIGVAFGAYSHHFSMMSRTKGEFKKEWWVESREKAFREKWGVSSKETHLIGDKKFRLDIGSGERPKNDGHWLHMDVDRQFKDIEYLQDISGKMPFDDGEFEEIYSSNALEHVEWKDILPTLFEWHRILRLGGKIHIRVPNFRFAAERYLEGSWKLSLQAGTDQNLTHLIFGGDHPGYPHLHKVGLDFENLSQALKDVGFTDVKNVSENGSWELRIEAIK